MTDLALPHPGPPRPDSRAGRWLTLGLAVAAVAAAVVLVAHAARPEYGVPGWGVAVAAGLLAAVLGGAWLVWTTGRFGFAARVGAGVAVVIVGLLSLASIGLPLLLVGVLILAAVTRSARGSVRAVAGATLVGAALPMLVLLALSGPVVTCGTTTVNTEENAFMALGSGGTRLSGEMTSAPAGTTAGRSSGPGYTYSYVCRGDRLASFHLRWR